VHENTGVERSSILYEELVKEKARRGRYSMTYCAQVSSDLQQFLRGYSLTGSM
jgi:hypothetical protein